MGRSKYNITDDRFIELHNSASVNDNRDFIEVLEKELGIKVPLSFVVYKRNKLMENGKQLKEFKRCSHFPKELFEVPNVSIGQPESLS